jgi:hypothetical protein
MATCHARSFQVLRHADPMRNGEPSMTSQSLIGWARTPLRRLRADLRDPLLRNGYALLVNVGVTSVLGFLYWIVAARTYSPEYVGLSSTAIVVVQFLAGVAGQPSIANALTRFIPGPRSTRPDCRSSPTVWRRGREPW